MEWPSISSSLGRVSGGAGATLFAAADSNVAAVTLPLDDAQLVSALDSKMGFQLLELTPERVVGRMPVEGNTQPFGLWHGGASCVLAETLASLGSYAHGHPDRVGVGVDLNATHHRPARSGWVTGTATALRLGRTVVSYEVVLVDDAGDRLCTARVTCQLVPAATR